MSLTLTQYIDAAITALGPPVTRTAPATLGYGRDLSCVTDLTVSLAEVDPTTPTAIGQALLRWLITPRGGVVDAPTRGMDLRGYCNSGVTNIMLQSIAARVRAEAMRDDRVTDCNAEATYSFTDRQLTVRATITPEDVDTGEFSLTFFVTSDGAALLTGSIDQNG